MSAVSPLRITRFAQLPRHAAEVWQGGLVRLPIWVEHGPAVGRDLSRPARRMSAHEVAAGVGGHDPDLALEGVDYCVVKEAAELPSVQP